MLLNHHVIIRQGLFFDTYHYKDSSFILGENLIIAKEFTCSSKGIFHSIHPRDVKSNTNNVHPSVTPSSAPQLKCRLCPHEGISECRDHTREERDLGYSRVRGQEDVATPCCYRSINKGLKNTLLFSYYYIRPLH